MKKSTFLSLWNLSTREYFPLGMQAQFGRSPGRDQFALATGTLPRTPSFWGHQPGMSVMNFAALTFF